MKRPPAPLKGGLGLRVIYRREGAPETIQNNTMSYLVYVHPYASQLLIEHLFFTVISCNAAWLIGLLFSVRKYASPTHHPSSSEPCICDGMSSLTELSQSALINLLGTAGSNRKYITHISGWLAHTVWSFSFCFCTLMMNTIVWNCNNGGKTIWSKPLMPPC